MSPMLARYAVLPKLHGGHLVCCKIDLKANMDCQGAQTFLEGSGMGTGSYVLILLARMPLPGAVDGQHHRQPISTNLPSRNALQFSSSWAVSCMVSTRT